MTGYGGPGGMSCGQEVLLGGYLLGALEPAERESFAAHLSDCPSCAAQLSSLGQLPELLDRLDLADVTDPPPVVPPSLFDRVHHAVHADARRTSRRRAALAAAASVVVAAGAGFGIHAAVSGPSTPTFQASAGGVTLAVGIESRSTGSELHVKASGLPLEEHCELLAVSRSGARESAGAWVVGYHGTASVVGTTSYDADQLADLVLLGSNGQPLVSVRTT